MQDIRRHKESFYHSRFWIVVLLVICVILTISVIKIYFKYNHAKSVRDDYRAELAQVQQHEADLEKNIGALSTERGKEEEIRDRYRVVKQGEQMILIIDDTQEKELKNEQVAEKKGFFSEIWSKIANLFN